MSLLSDLKERFDEKALTAEQAAADGILTLRAAREHLKDIMKYLKYDISQPFRMLYDLTAIDERLRSGIPGKGFMIVYHLTSFERNEDIRIKVMLEGEFPSMDSISDIWPCANWYEREVFDMFGIKFDGHPDLRRILMPGSWKGYPLRKDYAARATEYGPYVLNDQIRDIADNEFKFKPEDWGLKRSEQDSDYMFLNIGPQHPGTHGLLRLILQLDGEDIVEVVPDIGYHHRGAEKMGERQTWHTYIPYTDRVEYLSGINNNLAYLLPVEKMAGIEVPDRAKVIRVMLSELFRLSSHLVFTGTYAQDLGQMSPVFYSFNARERIFDIIQAVTGARMHPSWLRIGGCAHDLPRGWDTLVRDFVKDFPKSVNELEKIVLKNRIFKARTVGIGVFTTEEAIEWGTTGPNLRSTGFDWDYRKKRPYSGYENFEFDIPVGKNGDCYDRFQLRLEEMRQSLRIIQQCLENMPAGDYKSRHPLTTPPLKERTMYDIETLITHFLGVTWGPVIPKGEAMIPVEAPKGSNAYYLVSDGGTSSYRTRIRTPSFPHVQMVPLISRGYTIPDLLAILGATDFVLADLDR